MTDHQVIAIDGTAGSGKSTLARNLARTVHLPYVNTGLMYRALTASAIRNGVSDVDVEGLIDLTRGLRFTLEGSDPLELKVRGGMQHRALAWAGRAPVLESRTGRSD